ncbi:TIGR00730 family Rossman fold protein [Lentzea xinjiangensis]|nr:TIGR00730 family Rossman fold protein [Lentzea xinjiangensis]
MTSIESRTITVFCGARPGSPAAAVAAERLGHAIGMGGHRLVYGAGGVGLMEVTARAAAAAGAVVTGVVPRFLYELDRVQQAVCTDLVVTDDMFERKRLMIDRADAFVALPGGFGTLDEVLEVIALAYLGQCPKPLALVDVDGHWDALCALFTDVHQRGFTRPGFDEYYQVTASPEAAVDFVTGVAARTSHDSAVTCLALAHSSGAD